MIRIDNQSKKKNANHAALKELLRRRMEVRNALYTMQHSSNYFNSGRFDQGITPVQILTHCNVHKTLSKMKRIALEVSLNYVFSCDHKKNGLLI